jgi:hypothetical protein
VLNYYYYYVFFFVVYVWIVTDWFCFLPLAEAGRVLEVRHDAWSTWSVYLRYVWVLRFWFIKWTAGSFLLPLHLFDWELGIVCIAVKQYVGQFLGHNKCFFIVSHFTTLYLSSQIGIWLFLDSHFNIDCVVWFRRLDISFNSVCQIANKPCGH